jgi:adenosylcobinamide amidohydrolase
VNVPVQPDAAALSISTGESARAREAPVTITQEGAWLVARFAELQRMASWAILGGGLRQGRTVAWLQVSDADLRPPVDAREFLRARLEAAGIPDAAGLLTSRSLHAYVDVQASHRDAAARCIATVGLSNALRAGDPPGPAGRIGTINLLCHVSGPLSEEAMLEALALAAEARTLAVREASIPSQLSGEPASGTGTDCIVVAAPVAGEAAQYAGKHTVLGHLIGHVVYQAVSRGVAEWQRERAAASARDQGAR